MNLRRGLVAMAALLGLGVFGRGADASSSDRRVEKKKGWSLLRNEPLMPRSTVSPNGGTPTGAAAAKRAAKKRRNLAKRSGK